VVDSIEYECRTSRSVNLTYTAPSLYWAVANCGHNCGCMKLGRIKLDINVARL